MEEIKKLISGGHYSEALHALDRMIENAPSDASLWYQRGSLHWKLGDHGSAISDYEEAVHLQPDSPARHALEMARGIMDFFNPDMLNP